MAEGETSGEIVPYRFEPVAVSNYSYSDTSSSESESDITEQGSFMERLGSTNWCECTKCAPMPSGIECQCCMEMEGVVECVAENESHQFITDHEQFKVVCLNKDVLYTALVMMNMVRGDPVSLPLPNRLYRLAAYRQFIYWTHQKLGKRIRKVIPSCVVVAIRHEFPEADNTYTGFKIYREL